MSLAGTDPVLPILYCSKIIKTYTIFNEDFKFPVDHDIFRNVLEVREVLSLLLEFFELSILYSSTSIIAHVVVFHIFLIFFRALLLLLLGLNLFGQSFLELSQIGLKTFNILLRLFTFFLFYIFILHFFLFFQFFLFRYL